MKHKFKLVMACLIAVFILLSAYSLLKENAVSPVLPQVKNGIIDLTSWDFAKNGVVPLDGYWEFYWDKLLAPADFALNSSWESLVPTGYIKVPTGWKGVLGKTELKSKGLGTYHLKIKVPTGYPMYGIKTTNIRMSHKLFVNGRLAGGSGNPAITPDDGYLTRNVPYTTYFPAEGDYLEIIVQVADFNYLAGGIVHQLFFGSLEAIAKYNLRVIFLDFLTISMLIITGIYFFGVYAGGKKDPGVIYFGLFCLLFAFFAANHNEKVLMQYFPALSFLALIKVKVVSIFLNIILLALFIRSIGKHLLPNGFLIWLYFLSIFSSLLVVFFPFEIYSRMENVLLLIGLVSYFLISVIVGFRIFKKQYGEMEPGRLFMLCGITILILLHFISELFYNSAILQDRTAAAVSLLMIIFSVSAFISKQYSDAYNKAESLNEQLIRMDKAKDEFLLNTSHELKTPLHGIMNITRTVLDGEAGSISAKQREDLNYVITIARRLTSLINDIIDFQSIKSNKLHLNTKVFDINGPVQIVIEVLGRLFKDKNITVLNRIKPGLYHVKADEDRVRQIVFNLVGNALKFTETGSVLILAERIADEVVVTFKDTGLGIKKELQEHIFAYFEHSVGNEHQDTTSSGLGLPIARKLAERMEGRLWVQESEPGKGSVFAFSIPAAAETARLSLPRLAVDNPQTGATLNIERSLEQGSAKQEFSILIVDDEITNIKVIADVFAGENCAVFTAFNGLQALEIIRKNRRIGLVLLDVMMPGMSGLDVCRRIRKDYTLFELPVLLLTVKNSSEDIAAGFDAGANDFATKPFDAKELKARVRTLLELKQSVRNSIDAETAFLHSQIKPHFIYNALSVIMSLCYVDAAQAGKLLAEFSNYLRCSFDFDPHSSFVSLEKELSLVRSYVEIEKARFGQRLNVVYDMAETMYLSKIPALILQPLVENAIRHGLMKRLDGGTIILKAWAEGTSIRITVKDDGIGIPAENLPSLLDIHNKAKKGVGLRNIHQRLLNLYGHGLEIESQEGKGTLVMLSLPYFQSSSISGADV